MPSRRPPLPRRHRPLYNCQLSAPDSAHFARITAAPNAGHLWQAVTASTCTGNLRSTTQRRWVRLQQCWRKARCSDPAQPIHLPQDQLWVWWWWNRTVASCMGRRHHPVSLSSGSSSKQAQDSVRKPCSEALEGGLAGTSAAVKLMRIAAGCSFCCGLKAHVQVMQGAEPSMSPSVLDADRGVLTILCAEQPGVCRS
jgi:hypothetical protein